jgi:hypothetical protein
MRHARKARGLGLVLSGLLVGMLLITPATAHFTTNTQHLGKHAWQQFIKQKVYTKKQSNNRFLPNTVRFVRSDSIAVPVDSGTDASVSCPSGMFATGGGIASSATTTFHNFLVLSSHPSDGDSVNAGRTGWHVRVRNNSPTFVREFRVYVMCVRAGRAPANYDDGAVPTFTGTSEEEEAAAGG